MNAETRVLAEPAEGSAGARSVARRILVATVLGFAMLVVLGGTSRADPLEPVRGATETVSETVAPVVETVTDTVSPVVQTASDVADPIVQTVTDTVSPVVQTASDVADPIIQTVTDTSPGRGSIEGVPPGPDDGGVRLDPRSPPPRSPMDGLKPRDPGASPATARDLLARSTGPIVGSGGVPSMGTPPRALSASHAGRDSATSAGAAFGPGGDRWPVAPSGHGVADVALALLVVSVALAGSLSIRPPPLTMPLVQRIVAPNGATLALSVERPG